MQIINPQGDLCQIPQLMPLSNGAFITDVIPLKGRICGISGEYEIKLFYGDYSKSTTFIVSSDSFSEPDKDQMILSAQNLLISHSDVIGKLFDISPPFSNSTSNDLSQLESDFVDLWDEFFADDLIIEINPLIRPAVSSSLDSVQKLLDNVEISFEIAKSIVETIFASIFYYEIGDKTKAIDLLSDAFVDIKNVNPEKVTNQRAPTFNELVRDLFDEWNLVSQAYTNDPHGSDVGYTADEIKRIEFSKKLDTFSNMVSTFYNAGFSEYVDKYNVMMANADHMIELANFVDAELKILEIGDYLSEHLVLHNDRIIYDISFDAEKDIWIINGAT